MAAFSSSVEAWRSLVEDYADDLPVDFLLMAMTVESGGNPCSTGIAGVEAGLFQLYFPDDSRFAGATYAKLRAPCVGNTQSLARSLTDDEKRLHVESGVEMVRAHRDRARQQVASNDLPWSEDAPDFWALVKLQHALPALPSALLPAYARSNGGPPSSWGEWRTWCESLSASEVGAINSGLQRFTSEFPRVFRNAEKVGAVYGGFLSFDLGGIIEGAVGIAAAFLVARFVFQHGGVAMP